MTKTWTLEVKKMMVTDDYYVEFPEEVLQEAGWKPGDTLKWTDKGDGSWSLTKINENTEDNPDEK
jgi:bifunctional DNA-binding transcriptional regulator/antitoxin component of YhaV-PrlF toxin-antitoxin module